MCHAWRRRRRLGTHGRFEVGLNFFWRCMHCMPPACRSEWDIDHSSQTFTVIWTLISNNTLCFIFLFNWQWIRVLFEIFHTPSLWIGSKSIQMAEKSRVTSDEEQTGPAVTSILKDRGQILGMNSRQLYGAWTLNMRHQSI